MAEPERPTPKKKPKPPSLRAIITGVPDREAPSGPLQPTVGPPPTVVDKFVDMVRGATIGSQGAGDTSYAKGAELAMAGVPLIGGLKGLTALKTAEGAAEGAQEAAGAARGIRAYHGSPHDIEKFDSSRIGTGQGAQTYGHGLYFAEAEPVARSYRNQLSDPPEVFVGGARVDPETDEGVAAQMISEYLGLGNALSTEAAVANVRQVHEAMARRVAGDPTQVIAQRRLAAIDRMIARGITAKSPGHMYEVQLNVDPEQLLDWDTRIGRQSPHLQEQIRQSGLEHYLRSNRPEDLTGQELYRGLEYAAPGRPTAPAAALQEAGIPGLRYLDQHSRRALDVDYLRARLADLHERLPQQTPNFRAHTLVEIADIEKQLAAASKPPTRNIVMFPGADDLIDILRKYGILPPIAGAALLRSMHQGQQQQQVGTPPPAAAPRF